jgi:methionine-rich copper-binding protein CopC
MRNLRLAAGVVLALALVPLTALPAYAHARPDRADPPIEGVVNTAPAVLQVWFTEGVTAAGSSLEVVDSAGNRVDAGDSRVDLNDPDRKRMFVTLGQLADGVYTVNWKSVSADDGDAAEGSFRFGVGAATVLPPLPAAGAMPRITTETALVSGCDVHLRVELSDNQHRDWNPPIVATTTVIVP